jgi:type II secretory pathway pseudopilin PulG
VRKKTLSALREFVAQLSKLRFAGSPVGNLRYLAGDAPAATSAFTIIELLIVMSIIIVLAGLILATSGYVQKKGARSRAETEIAAISAALESYKADNGIYPQGNAAVANTTPPYDTDQLRANFDPEGGNPTTVTFSNSGQYLYRQLSGDSDGNPTTSSTSDTKNYLSGGLRPNMLNPKPPNAGTYIIDPFGNAYGYSTFETANPGSPYGNNPTFDLWSTCGETGRKSTETFQQYQQRWIKNW